MTNAELLKAIGPELGLLLPELDEKARRLALGAVARAAGDGGIGAVAKVTGASWQTVANGAAELESGRVAPRGRVRRPGAGRPKLAETDPGLVPALLALVQDSAGGEWRLQGDPVRARSHDFGDEQGGHAIPYGVYDVGANTGFVSVGTDHNTAAFAVESVRRWWNLAGKAAYPHATQLLACCDAG